MSASVPPPPGPETDLVGEGSPVDVPPVTPSPAGVSSDDLTETVQRLAAEYKNFRTRTHNQAQHSLAQGRREVIVALLPVFDLFAAAKANNDLDMAAASAADILAGVLSQFNVVVFGAVGDVFDPTIHNAMLHIPSPDMEEPICTQVFQAGYRVEDDVLRPALVAVSG